MANKKTTKRKEVKPINIDADIHKMLKMKATIEDRNMVEIVESAILETIPDEILKMFKKSKNLQKKEVAKNNEEKTIATNVVEEVTVETKEVEEIKKDIDLVENVKNEEDIIENTNDSSDEINDEVDDEVDDETSCYF